MTASLTSSWGSLRARTAMRCCAAILLLFFGTAVIAGGGGHGGGHGGSHHRGGHLGGHGAHHGHGHGLVGFGIWYPWLYYDRIYCYRYAPDNDPSRCRGYYRFLDDRNALTPQRTEGTGGVAQRPDDDTSGRLTAVGNLDLFSVRERLLSSSEAPESLPEIGRISADRSVPATASGS